MPDCRPPPYLLMRIVVASVAEVLLFGMPLEHAAHAAEPADYVRDVQPILRARCFACHGPLKQEGGLRLDTGESIHRGGDSGPAVLAGKSAGSRLIERITSEDEPTRMPQEGAPLTSIEIEAIRQWIDAGAVHPNEPPPHDPLKHWSFVPPVQDATRAGPNPSNPIDRFIEAKYAEIGLTPVGPADKHTLLRRASVDLIGLPPTREELSAFLVDESPDAYEKVVDRLLASPRYGERWGRHWMDVWRYSDWDGYGAEVRDSQPHLWRWRDWIVESLIADKPYDQMIVEMLAADELSPLDSQALRATGFLARNYYKFSRNTWLDNTVEHTGKAFLGLTLNCARCHDHKYDPIAQQEYYEWRAAFEPHGVRTDPVPGEPDPAKNGLTRVYDATPDAPTYLFIRGNEKEPDEQHRLAPTLPRILGGGPLGATAVELPAQAWYPGLQAFAHADLIAAKQLQVSQSQDALHKAEAALAAAPAMPANKEPAEAPPATSVAPAAAAANPSPARAALVRAKELADANLAVVKAELAFLTARSSADRGRYATPPASDVADLIKTAVQAERVAKAAAARQALLVAQQAKDVAVESKAAADAIAKLEPPLVAAQQALAAAEAALGNLSGEYTPLGATYPKQSTGRRAALARKIADRSNPLTARVAVNHIWQRHFGAALVPTVFDFGHNGKPPVNQALLDWLAVEFMQSGWKMKPLHRLIVTSRVYRLASSEGPSAAENRRLDRDNLYLWHANPRRLEAEAVRDAVLLVDGRLDPATGGPDLDPATDADVSRRSLYFRHSKEKRVPLLTIFDQANVTECYRRIETIVPQQALAMANSPLVAKSAQRIAERLNADLGPERSTNDGFIDEAFLLILSRPCTAEERRLCGKFLDDILAKANGANSDAQQSAAELAAARESVVHTLLNHHDFVTAR